MFLRLFETVYGSVWCHFRSGPMSLSRGLGGGMFSLPVWSPVFFGESTSRRGWSVQPLPVLTSSGYHCSVLIRSLLECILVTYIFRLFLGFSDLDVQSVFRTTDGFIFPWINWKSHDPQGTAGHAHGLQDCGGRAITGLLGDYDCDDNHMYYCEGKLIWKLNTILDPRLRVSSMVLYRCTSVSIQKSMAAILVIKKSADVATKVNLNRLNLLHTGDEAWIAKYTLALNPSRVHENIHATLMLEWIAKKSIGPEYTGGGGGWGLYRGAGWDLLQKKGGEERGRGDWAFYRDSPVNRMTGRQTVLRWQT